MEIVTLFMPHPQASLVEELGKGRFHDAAVRAESTAMLGSTLGDQGLDHGSVPQNAG